MGLKSIFGQIPLRISLYHFPFLQKFDLKKPFKDLGKVLRPIPAIFPLTVRHGVVAFEHVTKP